jgi:DNA-binding response OmpR family regulator
MRVPVLVIVHDPSLREGIARCLREDGLEVSVAPTPLDGLSLARRTGPALVLLDHSPGGAGSAALYRHLRSAGEPLLLLLGTGGDEAEVVGALEAGADDYLRLPCSGAEILAHVRALLRRRGGRAGPRPREIRVGELQISLPSREVFLAGRAVRLAPKEFAILALLAQRAGRVVSRADLLRAVWPDEQAVKPATLDVHVFSLRTKIEEDPARPQRILTVRAVGYRLVEEE